jgi:uncharacterized protein YggE
MRTTSMIVVVLVASVGAGLHAQAPASPPMPTVVTTGQASVRRAPDMATISLGVESRARNPRDAQRQNAEAMTAVQKQLDALGVPKDARRTQGLWLQQEYDNNNGRQIPRDYVARNSLEVRIDEVARVGEIADAVVQGGATSLQGIQFDLKDRSAAEREAVRLAVADARGRAEAAAAGAGRMLDQILRIEESRPETIVQPRVALMRAEAASTTPVEPGLIDIRANVTFTASMK